MSYSLKIEAGDLVIGAGRAIDTVIGSAKLAQDLQLWVLERIGNDTATPLYGSSLDGGTVDGSQIPSFIGQLASQEVIAQIQSDIATMLSTYQQLQATKQAAEIQTYGKSTLSPSEILRNVLSIQAAQTVDQIIVRVAIQAGDGTTQQLTIPVATNV